jgi:hypothetical protein
MEKQYLNITKIPNIETLYNAGWLFTDNKKNVEIVLQVDPEQFATNNPLLIKVLYTTLCEGILNSNVKDGAPRHEIDYSGNIKNYEMLAKELSKTTGFRFTVGIVSDTGRSD